ncbi:MAG: hypothetical protein Q4A32_02915 [Lachnospiraceae bacterium]|nr:hypothetical protein [Lachnospiraceae bacterium]
MNSGNNYERAVDVGGFLKAIFARWRWMLILGIVFALILGMVPVLEYRQAKSSSASDGAAGGSDERDQYITDEEYEAVLTNIEKIMAGKRRYLADSYIMKIDPFNELVAKEYIYVNLILGQEELESLGEIDMMVSESAEGGAESDDEAASKAQETESDSDDAGEGNAPEGVSTEVEYLMNRVMSEYAILFSGGIDWSDLAETLGTEPKYIRECVSSDISLDTARLTVTVKSFDRELADAILDYVSLKIQEKRDVIADRLCDHELEMGQRTHEVIYDSSMRNTQENFISEIATSLTRYDNFVDARSNYVYKEKPTAKARLSKKTVLKNAVVGALCGILLAIALSAVLVFLKGCVISAKEITMSYGIRVLAALDSEGGKGALRGVDRWIGRLGTGDEGRLSQDERYKKAAQMTELYAGDSGAIVLTGDVSQEELDLVAAKLGEYLKGFRLPCCVSILGNAESLRESNGVILVEKKNESKLGRIEADLGMIGELGIPIIGAILL